MGINSFIYFLIGLKVFAGLFLLAIGLQAGENGMALAGAGHAFIAAPLWHWLLIGRV